MTKAELVAAFGVSSPAVRVFSLQLPEGTAPSDFATADIYVLAFDGVTYAASEGSFTNDVATEITE